MNNRAHSVSAQLNPSTARTAGKEGRPEGSVDHEMVPPARAEVFSGPKEARMRIGSRELAAAAQGGNPHLNVGLEMDDADELTGQKTIPRCALEGATCKNSPWDAGQSAKSVAASSEGEPPAQTHEGYTLPSQGGGRPPPVSPQIGGGEPARQGEQGMGNDSLPPDARGQEPWRLRGDSGGVVHMAD